ncbi:MAG: hypothetical protein NUW37_11975 [Planctomycetes bacterium]|nr:hypothetical protein [Planctomycetota bacterium]
MSLHNCDRCRKAEYIPTFQYVKFDLKVFYLCCECWNSFKSWMNNPSFQAMSGRLKQAQ